MSKIHHASCLIVEDHLKKVVSKTGSIPFKTSNNKHLPRAQHSAFGDFPKDYMKKNGPAVTKPQPLDKLELSVAAKATGKLNTLCIDSQS